MSRACAVSRVTVRAGAPDGTSSSARLASPDQRTVPSRSSGVGVAASDRSLEGCAICVRASAKRGPTSVLHRARSAATLLDRERVGGPGRASANGLFGKSGDAPRCGCCRLGEGAPKGNEPDEPELGDEVRTGAESVCVGIGAASTAASDVMPSPNCAPGLGGGRSSARASTSRCSLTANRPLPAAASGASKSGPKSSESLPLSCEA